MMSKLEIIVTILGLLLVAVILIETEYKPRVIKSDYGDIILVYNTKNGRVLKYLYKNE
jgi:hypothetical protein